MSEILRVEHRPGYARHWFDSQGRRLADAMIADFEYACENNEPIVRCVGRGNHGEGLYAFCMEIEEAKFHDALARLERRG